MKTLGLGLILAAMASTAFGGTVGAPEIDGSMAASAVTLIAGGMLVLRSRKK